MSLALTVIVPATNRPPTLGRCVAAIEPQIEAGDELIVVEECATPGPAAARNEGARRAAGDVLLFVDADVVVHPGALARVRAAFASDGSLAGLFGAYDDRPEAPGAVSRFRNLLHHHVHRQAAGDVRTFWAGLGAIDRQAFDRAGGFDASRYPRPSIEDIDLGVLITGQGGRIRCDPLLSGTHLKRWTLGSMLRTDAFDRGAPWVELLIRERSAGRSGAAELNLGPRHRISALASLSAALAAVARRPLVFLGSLGALVALNRDLYALLARRLGPARLPAALGAHLLHHLAAVTSVPIGLVRGLRHRSGAPFT